MRSRHTASRVVELVAADAFFAREPGAFVVLGCAVLRLLGERHVRVHGHQRRREQLALEALQSGEVGSERDHAEVGFVPEHRQRQRLVAVGFECGERVADVLGGTRIALGALTIDAVVEVENTPADRRNYLFHGAERTRQLPARVEGGERASLTFARHGVVP